MKNWLLKTISGTILLGVIGTALWEGVLRPSSGWLLSALVNIATLGMKGLQDGIYLEIAKGFHEDTSLKVLLTIYSIFITMLIGIPFVSYLAKKYKNEDALKDVKMFSFFNSFFGNKIFMAVFITFYLVFFIFGISRDIFINQAITYYVQIKAIALPYIDDKEHELLDSSFAQIKNSNDYEKIKKNLEEIILTNKQTLPEAPSVLSTANYPF